MNTVSVGVGPLSIDDVVNVARFDAPVELTDEALATIADTRHRIEELANDPTPVYGISTGFGALARRHIPKDLRAQLQRSLVRSHAAGSGPEVEREVVRALMLLGPTASGKTALALELARHLPVEIISVDSALVYRDMDIGTAKPTVQERNSAPHHLIDIRDPVQSYSAAEFSTDAWRLIDEIEERGRLPLLVGGTMLYARTLLHPMDDLPGARPDIRARLDAEAAEHGWPYLHQRLATLDPITAQRLHATDAQRIQRALEIIEITGQPLSTLHAAGQKPKAHPDIRIVSLEPSDRSQLHARIAQRFAQMLDHGFIDEVKRLHARPELHAALRDQIFKILHFYLDPLRFFQTNRPYGFDTRACRRI